MTEEEKRAQRLQKRREYYKRNADRIRQQNRETNARRRESERPQREAERARRFAERQEKAAQKALERQREKEQRQAERETRKQKKFWLPGELSLANLDLPKLLPPGVQSYVLAEYSMQKTRVVLHRLPSQDPQYWLVILSERNGDMRKTLQKFETFAEAETYIRKHHPHAHWFTDTSADGGFTPLQEPTE